MLDFDYLDYVEWGVNFALRKFYKILIMMLLLCHLTPMLLKQSESFAREFGIYTRYFFTNWSWNFELYRNRDSGMCWIMNNLWKRKKSYCDFLTLTLTYLNPSLSQFRPSRQLLSIINIWILSLRKSSFQNVQLFLGKWRSVSSSCWSRIWVVEAIISGLLYATVFLEFIWTT